MILVFSDPALFSPSLKLLERKRTQATLEMYFPGILVAMLWEMSQAFPAPVDTVVVQFQQWVVVGAQEATNQVLLNGVSLTGTSQEIDSIIQNMSADAHLPDLISQTSQPRTHIVLRSRECILEGSRLHWADRLFCDGKVYLTLDLTDTWTAHVPQAWDLKELWDREVERTKMERILLQEGCIKLMRELRLSALTEDHSVPGAPLYQFIVPVLAFLTFTGLIMISVLGVKKFGLRHPGGVIGSVTHYPKDMSEGVPEVKGDGYQTL